LTGSDCYHQTFLLLSLQWTKLFWGQTYTISSLTLGRTVIAVRIDSTIQFSFQKTSANCESSFRAETTQSAG